jgi:hypothetical protein
MTDNTDNTNNSEDNQHLENLEQILNTYVMYYKKAFPDEKLNSFFDNITNYDDTNKMMEHFYQCLQDYKVSKMKNSLEYNEEQLEEIEEKYILVINDENKYMSDNIISLLIDVINNNYDICENWNIIDI